MPDTPYKDIEDKKTIPSEKAVGKDWLDTFYSILNDLAGSLTGATEAEGTIKFPPTSGGTAASKIFKQIEKYLGPKVLEYLFGNKVNIPITELSPDLLAYAAKHSGKGLEGVSYSTAMKPEELQRYLKRNLNTTSESMDKYMPFMRELAGTLGRGEKEKLILTAKGGKEPGRTMLHEILHTAFPESMTQKPYASLENRDYLTTQAIREAIGGRGGFPSDLNKPLLETILGKLPPQILEMFDLGNYSPAVKAEEHFIRGLTGETQRRAATSGLWGEKSKLPSKIFDIGENAGLISKLLREALESAQYTIGP